MDRTKARRFSLFIAVLVLIIGIFTSMPVALAADVPFGGTLTEGNYFHRPDIHALESDWTVVISDFTGCTLTTDNYNYFTRSITPDTSGLYTIEVTYANLSPLSSSYGYGTNTPAADDTSMFLYYSTFDPNIPLGGILYANEDIAYSDSTPYSDSNNFKSRMANIPLNAGTTYVLVMTSFSPGVTGPVQVLVSGAGTANISTNQYSSDVTHVPVTDITDVPATITAGSGLALTGTVSPAIATNQSINWSVKNPGTTGAVINGSTVMASAAGTVTVTATIVNGKTPSENYTKDFDITVNAAFVPVTDISNVPTTATAGEALTLTGTVTPEEATNQTITWSVKDAGTTEASISGDVLSTNAAGTVKVTATIVNGVSAIMDYTEDFDITVNAAFVPVTDISDVPTTATAGEALTLTGTVTPEEATNQTITWSVKDAGTTGAVIDDNTLSTTDAGTVKVTATIVNGVSAIMDYTEDFDITVNAAFVPVTDISDVPTTATAGEALTLTGTVTPEDATNRTITWSVKDAGTTEASISGDVLSTNAAGTVKVTATIVNGKSPSEDYTEDFDITVNAAFVPVTDISDVPTMATAGEALTLTGTVTPDEATNQTITWSVSNAGSTGASISGDVLSANAAGTVKVTATIVNGKSPSEDYTEDFDITVNAAFVPVTDISDVPTMATAGEALTLTGTVTPEEATNQTITWSVADAETTEASISEDILSANAAGTVKVTATIANGKSPSEDYTEDFDITVNAAFVPVTDISDAPTTATAGEALTLTGTVTPEEATNQTITWSVSNAGSTGASINGDTLSTTAAGTVTVTATIMGGKTPSENFTKDFTIAVSPFVPVTVITNVPTTAIVRENLLLTGTVVPSSATNQAVVWSVKDTGTARASINYNRLLARALGVTTVTATVVNGASPSENYSKDFVITSIGRFTPATDITDVPTTTTAGSDLALTGTVSPSDATNQTITWSVKDAGTTGASINGNTLSTTAVGTVTVTATIFFGATVSTNFTKDFDITVGLPFVPVTDITDVPTSATVGEALTLTGTVAPGNATNRTITWNVKNAGLTGASISGNTMSATGAGTVIVTATVVNGASASTNYSKDFDITVNAAFVPVTDIIDVPTSATAGEDLTLTGMVTPANATNRTITWNVKNAGLTGASISGNTMSATGAGTVIVTATVVNGTSASTDYTKDFDVTVNAAMANDTLEEEVGETTVAAEGLFAPNAQLIVVPITANEPDREELEEQMGSKQIIAAFEAHIEPENAFQPPLTLTFQVGGQYDGKTVYILHRLQDGSIEQFTPTVADGAVSIIVQELSPFLLAVDAPLIITTQPQDVSAVEGQMVTFSVWATGEGPLTYQWQRGNESKAPWADIPGATAPEYTIEHVGLSASGSQYRVIVTDALENSVPSDVVTLTVTKAPESPDTGDHSRPVLYAALMILFAATLMMLLRKRRA